MRGKLNGSVFSRNRYAAYARNKVSPINPRTERQQEIRNQFAQLSQTWRTLHPENIDAWNLAVYDFLKTNIFGDRYKPSGLNLFMRINMNRYNIGKPMLILPPLPVITDLIKIVQIKIDVASNYISIIIKSDPYIHHTPLLSVTRPLSPGINFVKSEFRILDYTLSNDPLHSDQYILKIGPQYIHKFGNLSNFIGQKLFIKVLPIDSHTGINGIPMSEKAYIQ